MATRTSFLSRVRARLRAHYIALDETAVADEVLTAIARNVRAATTPSAPPEFPKAG
jgi:hypothetical protein